MWLENYQNNIIQNGKIQELDLTLSLHYVVYIIQLLSPMIHFILEKNPIMDFNTNQLSIEKSIGIGMISISPNEFQYILQFEIIEDIGKEMISYKKNYEDLEKEISFEFQKINVVNHLHGRNRYKKFSSNEDELLWKKLIKTYFPQWKEKNIIQESIDRLDYQYIFYNYYRKEYDGNINTYVKIIDEIKKISENYKKILKDIKNYLKFKNNFI